MSNRQPQGRVENFINAFLVSFGVLIFMVLLTINALLGFLWAVGTAYACDKSLSRLNRRA